MRQRKYGQIGEVRRKEKEEGRYRGMELENCSQRRGLRAEEKSARPGNNEMRRRCEGMTMSKDND